MNTKGPSENRSLIVQAIIGGIIGGIIVDTFLLIALHVSPIALEARNAALVAGPGASPVLGLIAHFAIAIAWAVAYAYAFNALGQLRNWILGTIVLGIVGRRLRCGSYHERHLLRLAGRGVSRTAHWPPVISQRVPRFSGRGSSFETPHCQGASAK